MSTCMIWFNDGRSRNELQNSLLQAMDDYQHWYGIPHRQCQANPNDLNHIKKYIRKLRLQLNSNPQLEPGQFWLGS